MRYTVTWLPSAQGELARLWIQAEDRQAVTDAANEMEWLLKYSPLTVGEDHGPYHRLVVEPLDVIFRGAAR